MDNETLQSIRNAEKASHINIYSSAKLFEEGSWLHKPVKTVLDILPLFENCESLTVLDLGCGVGRNCIPIAQNFRNILCKIDCVDILEFAIEELVKNAKAFGVSDSINGIVSSIDDYVIEKERYDFIFSVSALEHVDSKESLILKLNETAKGLKGNGIVCLIINSQIVEVNLKTKKKIAPQFEVNLKTNELKDLLYETFNEFETLKFTVREQRYEIPRENCISDLSTDVVTFVARKR